MPFSPTFAFRTAPSAPPKLTQGKYFVQPEIRSDAPGFHPVQGGLDRCPKGTRIDRCDPRCHCIEFVLSGRAILIRDGRRIELTAGQLILHRPQESYQISATSRETLTKYWIGFTGADAGNMLKACPLIGIPINLPSISRFRELFSQIIQAGEDGDEVGLKSSQMLLEVLLLQVQSTVRSRPTMSACASQQSYERCLSVLESEFASLRSAACLAQRAGINPSYLSRLFQEYDDEQPHRKLLRLKLERAAQLLGQGTLIVKECAAAVGFDDQLHFSRVFKKHFGLPPREFLTRRNRHFPNDHTPPQHHLLVRIS